MFNNVSSFFLILLSALGSIIGNSLFRLGLQKAGVESLQANYLLKNFLSIILQPLVLFGFIAFAISAVIWLRVLSIEPLNKAYPILVGLVVLLLVISSTIFLREPLTFVRFFGMGLIVLGAFLVF